MKNSWLGAVLALTLLFLVGCGTNNAGEVNEQSPNEPSGDVVIDENNGNEEEIVVDDEEVATPDINAGADENTNEVTQTDPLAALEAVADEIIIALNNEDMATINTYVHPDKGLLFSPYINIKPDAITITKQEIPTLLDRTDTLEWGIYDGIGTPILLTPPAYFDEFLDMALFLQPDDKFVNEYPVQRGNMVNNLIEWYPESLFVEYYHEGTAAADGMDWESVILVLLQDEAADYYLIAIVRDMWTS